jgi:hypothetical protein
MKAARGVTAPGFRSLRSPASAGRSSSASREEKCPSGLARGVRQDDEARIRALGPAWISPGDVGHARPSSPLTRTVIRSRFDVEAGFAKRICAA